MELGLFFFWFFFGAYICTYVCMYVCTDMCVYVCGWILTGPLYRVGRGGGHTSTHGSLHMYILVEEET